MPVQKSVVASPSAMDVFSRYRTPRMVKPGAPSNAERPELESALETIQNTRERMLAQRMLEVSLQEQEAEVDLKSADVQTRKVEAEAARMEAQVHMAELKEKLNGNGGGRNDAILLALVEKVMQPQTAPAVSPEILRVLESISANMNELRSGVMERLITHEDNPNDVVTQLQGMVALKQAMDALFPSEKPAVAAQATGSVQEAMMLTKLEYDHKVRLMELDERRAVTQRELDLKREQLEADSQRTDTLSKMASNVLESFAPVIKDVVSRATGVSGAPVQAPVAAPVYAYTAPYIVEAPQAMSSASNGHEAVDFEEETCPFCKQLVKFPHGATTFNCPSCGQSITVDYEDQVSEAETPKVLFQEITGGG